jgi:hypothetical protein
MELANPLEQPVMEIENLPPLSSTVPAGFTPPSATTKPFVPTRVGHWSLPWRTAKKGASIANPMLKATLSPALPHLLFPWESRISHKYVISWSTKTTSFDPLRMLGL